jgi:hypothetical protein
MARSIQTPLGALARAWPRDARHAAIDLLRFARYKPGGGDERLLAWEFSAGLKDWEQAPAPAQIGSVSWKASSSVSSHPSGPRWSSCTGRSGSTTPGSWPRTSATTWCTG